MTRGRQNPKPSEDPCPHGERAGIVTSHPDGYPAGSRQAHAAATVCGRNACLVRAQRWIHIVTGRPGVYISDADRKARQ